jgi:hypothetical protein
MCEIDNVKMLLRALFFFFFFFFFFFLVGVDSFD